MDANATASLPGSKDALLGRVDEAWSALHQTVAGMDEPQLTGSRDASGWSAKDHLAHIALWERSIVNLLRGQPRHEGMGLTEEQYLALPEDDLNAIMFARWRDCSLAEVRATLRDVHQQTLDTLARLSWGDLQKTYSRYLPDEPGEDSGEPVLRWVVANTASHYDAHRRWIKALAGDDR